MMSEKGLICRVYKVNREKLEEFVKGMLDILYELDPEAVKKWIGDKWPHGYGLFD